MIIWLASYPRSGNTFLRVVLHRVYNVPTYSIYDDDDPVAQRIGPALVGYREKPSDRSLMTDSRNVHFVKTHKRRKSDGHPAIYLVRDGRDAVVSQARLRASSYPDTEQSNSLFERLLREEIARPYFDDQPSSGTWGSNVLSWLDNAGAPLAILRYEDLVVDPHGAVRRAVSSLVSDLVPDMDSRIPSFGDLYAIDGDFFRRGKVGSHRDEMPEALRDFFYAQPENATAMQLLGYKR